MSRREYSGRVVAGCGVAALAILAALLMFPNTLRVIEEVVSPPKTSLR